MSQHDETLIAQSRGMSSEAAFDPGETFYSRTDSRGVILEGNRTFRRISGYGWQELKGAPHKLVRHPDMPKGLFQLMWDRLKSGKRVVAYVKNRTKDGRFYWVLALTWSIEGGYLSVRIKPTTDLRDKVEALYGDMLDAEQNRGMSPADSAEMLLKRLKGMGFDDYDSFMIDALPTEFHACKAALNERQDPVSQKFFDMRDKIADLNTEIDGLVDAINHIRTVPMNMRIQASRLENAGGPISAISVNYSQMLEDMSSWIKEFVDGPDSTYARINRSIRNGLFLSCASNVQDRMTDEFAADLEGIDDPKHLLEDKAVLEAESVAYHEAARESLKSIDAEVRRLARAVLDMKRYVTGLSSTRMMCKIESAALAHDGKALSGIVEQLDSCQTEIEDRLARVVELNAVIQANSTSLATLL